MDPKDEIERATRVESGFRDKPIKGIGHDCENDGKGKRERARKREIGSRDDLPRWKDTSRPRQRAHGRRRCYRERGFAMAMIIVCATVSESR